MNIDAINISLSWTNIRDIMKDLLSDVRLKDIEVEYDNCIKIRGKYTLKIDIPFSITVARISCSQGNIIIDIGDVDVYVKVPPFFRDILINNIIKRYNGGIAYLGSTLVIKKELISSFLPFDDYRLASISAEKECLKINLNDIKLQTQKKEHKD